jgi:hypothetical protein
MTSRARPGISKGLLAQLIALVRADEAGSLGDETEMVDLGGIAAAAVAERVPAALAASSSRRQSTRCECTRSLVNPKSHGFSIIA